MNRYLPASTILTEAAGRIFDVFMGGDTTWRERLDQSEILESADWAQAMVYARAALADGTGRGPSPTVVDGDESRDEQ